MVYDLHARLRIGGEALKDSSVTTSTFKSLYSTCKTSAHLPKTKANAFRDIDI
jgi:hypothetical protein